MQVEFTIYRGLNTQEWTLQKTGKKHVIVIKRFDRIKQKRIPFLSAMSMLNAVDNDSQIHSYMDIADSLRQFGASPKEDMLELWKRIVFSILISNTDDHLRNHGFLYINQKGWKLSPLYDVNPSQDNKNVLSTYITEYDNSQSLDLALEVCEYFEVSKQEAQKTILEMKKVVRTWRQVATQFGLTTGEMSKMESAFKFL